MTMRSFLWIFDLEGTLTHNQWREHYAKSKNWHEFHENFHMDRPNVDMINLCNQCVNRNEDVMILTGKPIDGNHEANAWLAKHGVKCRKMIMRPVGNFLSSPDFKVSVVEGLIQFYSYIFVFDDRVDVLMALEKLNEKIVTFRTLNNE